MAEPTRKRNKKTHGCGQTPGRIRSPPWIPRSPTTCMRCARADFLYWLYKPHSRRLILNGTNTLQDRINLVICRGEYTYAEMFGGRSTLLSDTPTLVKFRSKQRPRIETSIFEMDDADQLLSMIHSLSPREEEQFRGLVRQGLKALIISDRYPARWRTQETHGRVFFFIDAREWSADRRKHALVMLGNGQTFISDEGKLTKDYDGFPLGERFIREWKKRLDVRDRPRVILAANNLARMGLVSDVISIVGQYISFQ